MAGTHEQIAAINGTPQADSVTIPVYQGSVQRIRWLILLITPRNPASLQHQRCRQRADLNQSGTIPKAIFRRSAAGPAG